MNKPGMFRDFLYLCLGEETLEKLRNSVSLNKSKRRKTIVLKDMLVHEDLTRTMEI